MCFFQFFLKKMKLKWLHQYLTIKIMNYTQYNVPCALDRINLNVGQPSPTLLNWTVFKESMSSIDESDNNILQYGPIQGFQKYREYIASLYQTIINDNICSKDNIFMTNGVSHALFLLASLYKTEYSKIYVENPTYFLGLNIFRELGYTFDVFDINNINKLKSNLLNDIEKNIKSLIYIIPFSQNPTGRTLNENEIINFLNCTYKTSSIIISDETYQMLNFNKNIRLKSLASYMVSGNIISLGTFSKLIAPALRLGWIYTHSNVIMSKLLKCGYMDSGGSVNQIMARILLNYLEKNPIQDIIKKNVKFLEDNCNKLCSILDKYPDFKYIKPTGGYFIWVRIPNNYNGTRFQEICSKNNIGYHIGSKFSPNNGLDNYFRLSYSYYCLDDYDLFDMRFELSIKEYENYDNNITLNILGGDGRLGTLICSEAEKEPKIIINKLKRDFSNLVHGIGNVIVDVSSIIGTTDLVTYLLDNRIVDINIIIGTTGDLPYKLIEKYRKINKQIIVCSNFSKGIMSICEYLKSVDMTYWDANITETHHVNKLDKPSGTAKTFRDMLNTEKKIEIESIRDSDVIGYHEIHLDSEYEEITIIHNAKDRRLFAKGCVDMVKKCVFNLL